MNFATARLAADRRPSRRPRPHVATRPTALAEEVERASSSCRARRSSSGDGRASRRPHDPGRRGVVAVRGRHEHRSRVPATRVISASRSRRSNPVVVTANRRRHRRRPATPPSSRTRSSRGRRRARRVRRERASAAPRAASRERDPHPRRWRPPARPRADRRAVRHPVGLLRRDAGRARHRERARDGPRRRPSPGSRRLRAQAAEERVRGRGRTSPRRRSPATRPCTSTSRGPMCPRTTVGPRTSAT